MLFNAYIKGLHKEMDLKYALLNFFEKSKREPEGDILKGSVYTGGNTSGQPVSTDGGVIPDGGRFTTTEASYEAKTQYVGLNITDDMFKYGEKSKAKYFDIIKTQFAHCTKTLEKMCSNAIRQWGAGVVASFDGIPSGSTSIQLHSAFYIVENKTYDVINATTGAVRGQIKPTTVYVDGTVDLESTVPTNTADNDYIAYQGAYSTTISSQLDPMGFQGLCDDDTIVASVGGLSSGTYGRYWSGNVNSSDGRAVNADPIFDTCNQIARRSGRPVESMICSVEFSSKLARQYITDARFTKGDMQKAIGPGYASLYIQAGDGVIEVISDGTHTGPVGTHGSVFLYNGVGVEFFEWFKPMWRAETTPFGGGPVLHRSSSNFEYVGELLYTWNLATFQRGGLGVVKTFDIVDQAKG